MTTPPFIEVLRRVAETVNADPVGLRLGRHCSLPVLLAAGETGAYLELERGRVAGVTPGPRRLRSYRFALHAPWPTWQEFWSPLPGPGFHDLFALVRFGHARLEGDLEPLLEHLPYFKRLLAIPRGFERP